MKASVFWQYRIYLFRQDEIAEKRKQATSIYTLPHDSGGVLWFHVGRPFVRPCVCPSFRPSVVRPSVCISFPDHNLSKYQWTFAKLGMCINIVEIWFGIDNGQISLISDGVTCPRHARIFISGQ